MPKYIEHNKVFYRQLPNGQLVAEQDPDVLNELKRGNLDFESMANTRPMTLGAGGTEPTAPTTLGGLGAGAQLVSGVGKYPKEQIQTFNKMLMSLLTKGQGLTAAPMRERQMGLEDIQRERIMRPTAGEELQLSPAQQAQVRGARVAAPGAQLRQVAAQVEERERKIENFPALLQATSQFAEMLEEPEDDIVAYTFQDDGQGNVTFLGMKRSGQQIRQTFKGVSEPTPEEFELEEGIEGTPLIFDPSTGTLTEAKGPSSIGVDPYTTLMRDLDEGQLASLAKAMEPAEGIFAPGENPQYPEGSLAWKNNNPGNLKWAPWEAEYGGIDTGVAARDGGTWAKFPDMEAGNRAKMALLQAGSYADLTVDAAMRRWSGGGYGGEIVSRPAPKLKIDPDDDLDSRELSYVELKAFGGLPAGTTWGDVKRLQLSPGEITDQEAQQTLKRITEGLDDLISLWDAVPGRYKFLGIGALAEAYMKYRDPEVAAFTAQQKIVGMQLTRLFEKGRISDQDRIFYLGQMPNLQQNKESAVASSDTLVKLLAKQIIEYPTNISPSIPTGTTYNELLPDPMMYGDQTGESTVDDFLSSQGF